jgi:hypothetical protein
MPVPENVSERATKDDVRADAESIPEAMAGILRQGIDLLESLDEITYTQRVPQAFDSTIGGHYRHCLEHFEPLVEGLSAVIDYDARKRDPSVENNREVALRRTRELLTACLNFPVDSLEIPVRVRYKVSYDATVDPLAESTVAREGMFAVSHAIHHFALIKVMAGLLNVSLPDGFGMAPSTAAFRGGSTF